MSRPRVATLDAVYHGLGGDGGHIQVVSVLDLARAPAAGEVDRAVLATARRIPVLGCRYRRGAWRDRWVPLADEAVTAAVRHAETDDLDRATRAAIAAPPDPESGPAWRLSVLRHGARTRLVLQGLHLLADARGWLAVVSELGRQLTGAAPAPPAAATRRLRHVVAALPPRRWPELVREVARSSTQPLGLRRVATWSHGLERQNAGDGAFVYATRRLGAAGLASLAAGCRDAGSTVNDALLAAGLAVAARRAAHGAGEPGRVGLSFTVDLRRYLPPAAGARVANLSGAEVLTLPPPTDVRQALAAVTAWSRRRKGELLGIGVLALPVAVFSLLPHALVRRLGAASRKGMAEQTARFLPVSNFGRLDDALAPWGELLEDAWMLGPFQRGLGSPVVVATTFRERLTVGVCGDDEVAPAALETLADEWDAALAVLSARAPAAARPSPGSPTPRH